MLLQKDTPKTVLCIDDDPDFLTVVQTELELCGYKVTTANNGKDGVKLAIKLFPDVITLDIKMPLRTGWQILRELKTSSRTRNIPIILLSVLRRPADIKLGLQAGADDYLCKPYSPDELCARIEAVIYRFHRFEYLNQERMIAEQSRDVLSHFLLATNDLYAQPNLETQLQLICQGISTAGLFRKIAVIPNPHLLKLERNVYEGYLPEELEPIKQKHGEHFSASYKETNKLITEQYKISKSYFIPAEKNPTVIKSKTVHIEAQDEAIFEEHEWKAEDVLLVPLKDAEDKEFAILSLTEPYSNIRPTRDSIAFIELFSDLATAVIQHNQINHECEVLHKRYYTIFNHSNEAIIVFDKVGNIKEANNAAAKLFKKTHTELCKQKIESLIPLDKIDNSALHKLKFNERISLDIVVDNQKLLTDIFFKSISFGSEVVTVAFISQLAIDSSSRNAENGKIDELLAAITNPIAITDEHGNLVKLNKAFRTSFDIEDSIIREINIQKVLPDLAGVWESLVHREDFYQSVISEPSTATRYTITSGKLVLDGLIYWIHAFYNISESERLTNELIKSEKLAVINQVTNIIASELALLGNEARNDIFAILPKSEIEFPSAVLSTNAELNREIVKLSRKYRSVARYHKPNLTTFNFGIAIQKVIDNQIPNPKITFKTKIPKTSIYIQADESLLSDAIQRLISNAIEAIEIKGEILLTINSLAEQNQVLLTIKDSGLGIEPNILAEVCNPFYTTKDYGLGMGLFIANGIINAHNGNLEIESEPQIGTQCKITLPTIELESLMEKEVIKILPSANPQILVLIDDINSQAHIKTALSSIAGTLNFQKLDATDPQALSAAIKDFSLVMVEYGSLSNAQKGLAKLLEQANLFIPIICIAKPSEIKSETLSSVYRNIAFIPMKFTLADLIDAVSKVR